MVLIPLVAAAEDWTPAEREILRSLWIGSSANRCRPTRATGSPTTRPRSLWARRCSSTRGSAPNGKVACATCHLPERQFQDGLPLGRGVGPTPRRTMPIAGTAYSPWLFWDGRKDSLWAQALGPLESAVEHGGDRTLYAHLIARHYRDEYEALFGPLPALAPAARGRPARRRVRPRGLEAMAAQDRDRVNRVFANLGKAIAAYERRLQFAPAPFDRYVEAVLAERRAAGRCAR